MNSAPPSPDLLRRLQDIRSRYLEDFALYWAITIAIRQLIGGDVEYPIQQVENWLERHAADQEKVSR